MALSDGLIFFGIVCFLIGIFMIVTEHKQHKKTLGNKKLADRINFYKNKWQGEHAVLVCAPFGVAVLLTVLSCITDLNIFLYLAGAEMLIASVIIYNKMMIYVEANAFNSLDDSEKNN